MGYYKMRIITLLRSAISCRFCFVLFPLFRTTLLLILAGAFFIFVSVSVVPAEPKLVTKDQIKEKINEYIINKTGWPENDLLIEYKTQVSDIELTSGEPDIQIKTLQDTKFLGFTPVKAAILLGNVVYRSFVVYLDIDLKVPVYMTNRWIKRHELLDKNNTVLTKSYRSKVPLDAVSCEKDFYGMALKVSLPNGKIITQSLIQPPLCIKRQDLVELVLTTDNLTITAKAIALMNGKKNEVIKLRNLDSKQEVYGRVIDEGTVEVCAKRGDN